jgi:uncharacterized protein
MDSGFDSSWVWTIGLIGFVSGLALGSGIGILLRGGRRRVQQLEEQLGTLEREFDSYRRQVARHFHTTSELVQKMTDSYRDVYEHLATSSQQLCQTELDHPNLDFTRQPLLDSTPAANTEAPRDQEFGDAETDPLQEAQDETCMGDAPRVPRLDIDEQPASSRTP